MYASRLRVCQNAKVVVSCKLVVLSKHSRCNGTETNVTASQLRSNQQTKIITKEARCMQFEDFLVDFPDDLLSCCDIRCRRRVVGHPLSTV